MWLFAVVALVAPAVGRQDDPDAVASLLAKCASCKGAEKVRVLHELVQYPDPRSLGPVVDAIGDDDPEVRSAAIGAFGRLYGSICDSASDLAARSRSEASLTLKVEAEHLWSQLKPYSRLRSSFSYTERAVREGRFGNEIQRRQLLTDLAKALSIDDGADAEDEPGSGCPDLTSISQQCAFEYVSLQCPELLRKMLAEPHVHFRSLICTQLAVNNDLASIPAIRRCLTDSNAAVRSSAAWSLGELHDKPSTRALVAALRDPWGLVRMEACRALSDLDARQAAFAIADLLTDPKPFVRQAAASALEGLKDPRVFDRVVEASHSADDDLRATLYILMTSLDSPRAVPILLHAVRDKDGKVRGAAVYALGFTKDSQAVDAAIEALSDKEEYVVESACYALTQLADERALAPLSKLLKSPSDAIRWVAEDALKSFTKDVPPPA